jgi:hypothetical protein
MLSTNTAGILGLPYDVLSTVWGLLSPRDCAKAACVCKKFRELEPVVVQQLEDELRRVLSACLWQGAGRLPFFPGDSRFSQGVYWNVTDSAPRTVRLHLDGFGTMLDGSVGLGPVRVIHQTTRFGQLGIILGIDQHHGFVAYRRCWAEAVAEGVMDEFTRDAIACLANMAKSFAIWMYDRNVKM